ncbi:MAG: 2-oxoacid:acceptor oxidoreductase family protein [Proteobacteria bacterium]|jgi:2-oxoglutarate ferredoxin oxidoreductase subunit gamma|nr:2-oxoacid:acceptor oxidoreductase family protein [Pseudomonadota bacterium]
MSKHDIRICGLGGQGVIMAGMIIGKAASIFEDRFATLVQSFGPEARGSECSAQVMVADEEIAFPYVRRSDIFVAMSQSAYDKFVEEMKEGAMLVHEGELVKPDARLPKGVKAFGIPATRIADEEFKRRIVFNMIMTGFIAGATKVVGMDAMRKAVIDSVPQGTETLNLKAFDRGYQYAVENYG